MAKGQFIVIGEPTINCLIRVEVLVVVSEIVHRHFGGKINIKCQYHNEKAESNINIFIILL